MVAWALAIDDDACDAICGLSPVDRRCVRVSKRSLASTRFLLIQRCELTLEDGLAGGKSHPDRGALGPEGTSRSAVPHRCCVQREQVWSSSQFPAFALRLTEILSYPGTEGLIFSVDRET